MFKPGGHRATCLTFIAHTVDQQEKRPGLYWRFAGPGGTARCHSAAAEIHCSPAIRRRYAVSAAPPYFEVSLYSRVVRNILWSRKNLAAVGFFPPSRFRAFRLVGVRETEISEM